MGEKGKETELKIMSGYVKLFTSIVNSTIWQEAGHVRLVWITMLALKNREQVVESSIPGLAKLAGVSLVQCELALERLKAPDKYSRTKEHEGRRIRDVDGGWLVLNGEKYRDKMSVEDRKAYKARKQAEYRAKKRARPTLAGESAGYEARVKEHGPEPREPGAAWGGDEE